MNILSIVAVAVVASAISGSIAYVGTRVAVRFFFNKEV